MKFFIVASCLVACAFAASVEDQNAETLRSSSDSSPDGSFSYTFETSNGISGQAEGHVKPSGKDEAAIEVSGSSQYISPEGEQISLTYIANENGYQPQGDHLPTPQPIPEYIVKALKFIEEHPYVEKKQ